MNPMAEPRTLESRIAAGEVDTVIVAFPDLQGRPVGKRVDPGFYLDHVAGHGIEACDYLLGVDVDMDPLPGYTFANWEQGYGDVVAIPDHATARMVPWVPGSAFVVCDVNDQHGNPVEVSPRQILRRQIERARERGFEVMAATELEFYLFEETFEEAAAQRWSGLTPLSSTIEDYQLLQTAREEFILKRIRTEMPGADIPSEFSKGEAGRGQHEVNVTYTDALTTCDRHLLFKQGIKEIAQQEGRSATFMAKWTMDDSGSSCHLHTSALDVSSGKALMPGDGPLGLSTFGQRFLAGQLRAARELAWCWAPYVNSYKRFVPGSWAPTAIAYGDDNRTCGFRIVGHGEARRVENRVPGADVNPYIALAASIAAGIYGLDHELELEPPFEGNAYGDEQVPRIPWTLPEAIEHLRSSPVAAEAFGPDVHHHLLNTAVQEWRKANAVVTDFELARNFERI